jgi:hypothetical protein
MRARFLPPLVALIAGVWAVGCSSTPSANGITPVTLSLSTTIEPFGEAYRCRFVRMPIQPDGAETFVVGGQHEMSTGTHHYLVYRTDLAELPLDGDRVTDCNEHGGAMAHARGWVTGGQTPRESSDFPAAAGLPFKSGEVLLLQAHFLNTAAKPLDAKVDVLFRTAGKDKVEHRAGVLQFYNPFIYVAPRATGSAAMRCPIPHDITLLSAGAHMHKDGVGYAAYIDAPGASPTTAPFYTTADWEHPTYWFGFQKIAAGSSIRYRCDYASVKNHAVVQGPSAEEDEMCMFGGFYYPAMSPEEESCTGQDMHGTGTTSCADTTSCLAACPFESRPDIGPGKANVGECWQKCIASSCPNVTTTLFPQLTCTKDKCDAECKDASSTDCASCVQTRCDAEWTACQTLACAP